VIKNDIYKKGHVWLEIDHPIFFNPKSIFPSLKIPMTNIIFELGDASLGVKVDTKVKENLFLVIEIEEEMIIKLIWFSPGVTPKEIVEIKFNTNNFKY